ncbi:GGDEF domain-containing protein [Agaribacter marinus]|uniref:diguanylate cyclase n=1 Tax=Agaribacter marinus TaxID=1431249 RepID=A0AA37WK14_9ALTE|nr:GGDEF domain-containing protein [Agaribacter marinus]GLR70849.1 diguanylate cyclase [Agaribacter marinus]
MSDDSAKRKLMVAKQQLDKLSIFIASMADFFQGTNPKIDKELSAIKKLLSGKPDYETAAELSVKINSELKNEAKYLKQQQLNTLSQIENSLRKLNEIDAIDEKVKSEIKLFLQNLSPSESNISSPVNTFEQALGLFRKALSNNQVSKSHSEKKHQKQLHLQIAQELKELLSPYIKNNPGDKAIVEIREKLDEGLNPSELLECCLTLIRFVIKDVIKESGSANKLIHDIHQSLTKVNQGIKKTIEKSKIRIEKREKQTADMKAQIDAIETALTDSNKVEDLKKQAQHYLTKMQSSLTKSEADERAEQEKMIALLQSMQKRLTELEDKASGYKQKLLEQRLEALTDGLTKLPNRVAYEEKAQIELDTAKKTKSPICIAIADIDHFKSINDKYGHSVGDKTLQVIATQIKNNLLKSDFVARWGGEEFVALLPNSNAEDAHKRLDLMREKISKLPFMFKGNRVSVTISIGMVLVLNDMTLAEAFEIADKRLYVAKENGRNQIQHEDSE